MHEYGGWTRHLSAYYSLHSPLKFNLQKYDAHALSYANTRSQFTVLVLSHHRGTLHYYNSTRKLGLNKPRELGGVKGIM